MMWRVTARGLTAACGTPMIFFLRPTPLRLIPAVKISSLGPSLFHQLIGPSPVWAVGPSPSQSARHWKPATSGVTFSFVEVSMCQCSYFHDVLMIFLFPSPPSLVALEVDSEEEGLGPKSLLSRLFPDVGRSEDKKETPPLAPDLTCTWSQSASACKPISKVKLAVSFTNICFHACYLFIFASICFLPCRTWVRTAFDFAPIPTRTPSSVLVATPGTATRRKVALVGKTQSA